MYRIPYADPVTAEIDMYRRSWEDLMRQRIRFRNRGQDYETGEIRNDFCVDMAENVLKPIEERIRRALEREIRRHPMADWLEEAKTMGARVSIILSTIGNPHRFPSQMCSEGCHMLPTFEAGAPCPHSVSSAEEGGDPKACEGIVGAPRHGTGCRSLWHILGLYPVVDKAGKVRLARRMKGVQGSYNPAAKTAILMPQGIAQQFYMQGSRYAEVYYEAKERLAAKPENAEKRPGWIDTTARVIAAKAWSGDLLMEWKRRVPLEAEGAPEIETVRGPSEPVLATV